MICAYSTLSGITDLTDYKHVPGVQRKNMSDAYEKNIKKYMYNGMRSSIHSSVYNT